MNSIDEILKMAANVQEEMAKAQATLDTLQVEGASGGGLVKVRATAKGRILGVDIDPSLLPADNGGVGFDNNADILSITPALMNRYMSAATKVSIA